MSYADIEKVNAAIRKDSNFLSSLNIMDYSILLGIESKVKIDTEQFRSVSLSLSLIHISEPTRPY